MKKYQAQTKFYIPDGKPFDEAIKRTTHLGIVAHHDDLEIGMYDGILKCFMEPKKWFMGVVVTDGRGSARGGTYANYSDEMMANIRILEQEKAAFVGDYGLQAFLNYASKETKNAQNETIKEEIKKLILDANPEVIYTHNLADKHDTHIGVVTKVVKAIRELPKEKRPKKLYGCEVWRDLDWLLDQEKVVFDVSKKPHLANSLIEIFDSQIDGAKRYDLACIGRRVANATYLSSHTNDEMTAAIYAIDLTPLIEDDNLSMTEFTLEAIERFKNDVKTRIEKMI